MGTWRSLPNDVMIILTSPAMVSSTNHLTDHWILNDIENIQTYPGMRCSSPMSTPEKKKNG
jgi:hypothetical protein